jgi:type II secretory pathway pseudopilin PulG
MVGPMPDWFAPHALLETVIVVSIVAIAAVGFVTGIKDLITDVRNLRRAKV